MEINILSTWSNIKYVWTNLVLIVEYLIKTSELNELHAQLKLRS